MSREKEGDEGFGVEIEASSLVIPPVNLRCEHDQCEGWKLHDKKFCQSHYLEQLREKKKQSTGVKRTRKEVEDGKNIKEVKVNDGKKKKGKKIDQKMEEKSKLDDNGGVGDNGVKRNQRDIENGNDGEKIEVIVPVIKRNKGKKGKRNKVDLEENCDLGDDNRVGSGYIANDVKDMSLDLKGKLRCGGSKEPDNPVKRIGTKKKEDLESKDGTLVQKEDTGRTELRRTTRLIAKRKTGDIISEKNINEGELLQVENDKEAERNLQEREEEIDAPLKKNEKKTKRKRNKGEVEKTNDLDSINELKDSSERMEVEGEPMGKCEDDNNEFSGTIQKLNGDVEEDKRAKESQQETEEGKVETPVKRNAKKNNKKNHGNGQRKTVLESVNVPKDSLESVKGDRETGRESEDKEKDFSGRSHKLIAASKGHVSKSKGEPLVETKTEFRRSTRSTVRETSKINEDDKQRKTVQALWAMPTGGAEDDEDKQREIVQALRAVPIDAAKDAEKSCSQVSKDETVAKVKQTIETKQILRRSTRTNTGGACRRNEYIKEDFQDVTDKEKELFIQETIIEEASGPSLHTSIMDYDQLFEENSQLKAENVKLRKQIDELEKVSRQEKPDDEGNGNEEEHDDDDNRGYDQNGKIVDRIEEVHSKENDEEILEREDDEGNKSNEEEIHKQVEVLKKVEKGEGNNNKALKLGRKKKAENNIEIIEVEKFVTESKNVEVGTSSQFQNINESRHFSYLEKGKRDTVLQFFSSCNRFSYAYKDETLEIQGRLLEDIMFDKFTDSEVINFYLKWLKKHPAQGTKCIYVSSLAWTHLKADQKNCIRRVLHDVLERELTDDINYVFFPMNTSKGSYPTEGYHWTLLVLNYQKRKFEHYNSMKPRRGSVDKFYKEAGIMRNEVVNWINKYRAETKKAKISWSQQINIPTCPQQGTSSDCGLYVCKIMEILSRGENLYADKDFQANVDKLKPTLTHLFLADKEHSWNVDNMHLFESNHQSPAGSNSKCQSPVVPENLAQRFESVRPTRRQVSRNVILFNHNDVPVANGHVDSIGEAQICHGRKVRAGEKKVYITEVMDPSAPIYDGPQNGETTLDGFIYGGYLIWVESRMKDF